MRFNILKISLFIPIFILFLFSCGDDESEGDAQNDSTKVADDGEFDKNESDEEVSIICMWEAVSLKETPTSNGKYTTTIYLGEVGSTYGEMVTDSSTSKVREYVKITLGDGTEGWIQENLMAMDATAHVVNSKTKLYKRPDILTASNKEFDRMQFVAVTEIQENWMKVKGKKQGDGWFSEGWVKSSNLTDSNLDVAVAILANRAMGLTEKSKKLAALNEIIENADFSGSAFIFDVKDMIQNLTLDAGDSDDDDPETEDGE